MQLADDIVEFLRGVPPTPFCPLAPEMAARATAELWAQAPLAEAMGLVVLNDTNDSDRYCAVTRGPASGAVVFLPHDDAAGFAFPSLSALREAMVRAASDGTEIWDVEPASPSPHSDQGPLRDHLRAALTGAHEDAANIVGMLLPLLDPDDVEILGLVATDQDFLIRESAARFMASTARDSQVALLKLLVTDRYPQVQGPARAALSTLALPRGGERTD